MDGTVLGCSQFFLWIPVISHYYDNAYVYYLVGAEIVVEIIDILENETNLVTFTCQATGEPVPTINWYFDGVMINISSTSKYNVTSLINDIMVESFITIMNTQSPDAGTYTCYAENIINSDSSSGILTVNGMYVCVVCSILALYY